MDDYNNKFLPDIRFSCIIPEWLFILQVLFLAKTLIQNSRLKSDIQQLHEADIHTATKRLELETEIFRLTKENKLLQTENQHLRVELSSISSDDDVHSSHMTPPMSEIVVNMAELSTSSVHAAELQTQTALAGGIHSKENTSQIHSNPTQSKETTSRTHSKENNSRIHSKANRSRRGLPSKEEKATGRPLPGSIKFQRESRVNLLSPDTKKILAGDYLTFYMGNLSYRANDATLKKSIEARFPISVDQAVVAYSSDGKSRGCAFVTVRWKEYLQKQAQVDSQIFVKQFCERLTGQPLFGRPVFVELACNQRRGG